MKKLLLAALLGLLAPPLYAAQPTSGRLVRSDCGTVPTPLEAGVDCLQTTTANDRTAGHVYVFRGGVWTDVDSGGGGSLPAGSNGQVQVNNAGSFGANSGFTYNFATNTVTVTGGVVANLTGNVTGNVTGNLTGSVTGNASTATALAANPSNCASGELAAGISANGTAEGCVDVATQAELNTHSALTGSSAHGATSANTASQIVTRDASGNFVAGTMTGNVIGNVTGNVTGNASTATALVANGTNCAAGEAAAGVDAAGNVEGCITVGGGGGTPVVLDLGNDSVNESTDLAKITTTGDTNSIFTEPNANELRIAVGNKWPASNTADALAANGTNCSAGNAPLGVDASGNAESCFDVATQAELNTHAALTGSSAHGATSANTASQIVARDASGNFSAGTITATLSGTATSASSLAANGSNCSAGSAPLGVNAVGDVEGCFDVATQAELDTHANLTTAHSSTSANTANRIVQRDGSGNFSAGTITATLSGSVSGNASTATALAANGANCSAGSFPLGVDASGAAEGCTTTATQTETFAAPTVTTVASLGTATANLFKVVTDANTDCTVGGGSTIRLCRGNGTTWDTIGDGTAGTIDHGSLTGLSDDDHTQYTKAFVSAGAPSAGSCTSSREIIVDTTNEEVYFCSDGAGGNPRKTHALSAAYTTVQGNSGSASPAAGGSTLNITGTSPIVTSAADGSPDAVTITTTMATSRLIGRTTASTGVMEEISAGTGLSLASLTLKVSDHVKSAWAPAGALFGDGTQCPAAPSTVTIGSGAPRQTFICADNDGSSLYWEFSMPDSWDGGTVTVMGEFIQTAADTSAMNSDVAAACRRPGDTINNTWGTEIALDIANMGGSNKRDTATTAAITPNGTCTGSGRLLQFRWQLDATGTTTAVATLHMTGFKVEYTVTGAGSD